MGRKKGILAFFCIYLALTVLLAAALFCMIDPLQKELRGFEAAQPEQRSAQIFEELFTQPDWQKLYRLAGCADTPYEGAAAYAAYMTARVGDGKLTYEEIYTDIPDAHKYAVRLGEERIAAFTLKTPAGTSQWTLDQVDIFFERSVSVTVEKKPEYTVYINGVALDDSFTLRSVATKAESYLPEGVHGYRMEQQRIDGLLVQPEIRVLKEDGSAVAVEQDPETGIYTLQTPEPEALTGELKTLITNAALADAKFAMRQISETELQQYFDAGTSLYTAIVANPVFVQKHKSASIDESAIEVGEYFRYSDGLFSANVKLTVIFIRKDDTIKEYRLDKTYFFSKNSDGQYLVTDYTNERIGDTVEQVRLLFVTGEDSRSSQMISTNANSVAAPEVTVPDGMELTGWATKTQNSNSVTMTVRLLPDGTVLGGLEPMELYPVFQPENGKELKP